MKQSNALWTEYFQKGEGASLLSLKMASEIDEFATDIQRRKLGQIDEKLFAETRLRRGAYGQRYDNGQRHDGKETRRLPYNPDAPTKGPDTVWDAPGMLRIKIPFGGLTPEQNEVLAELAEEYSDGIAHVTTRQDIQLHFVHIEDTPTIMRRLAAVGITTREACGNSVRNVTACPRAGVCRDEAFDVTHHARAFTDYFLGHRDVQDFGRKFKVSFSGCLDAPCGLAGIHDLGIVASMQAGKRGFRVYVGGGLGAVPQAARLLYDFLPEAELLPIAQSVARVFARLGEKQNRARARLKFLVQKLGIEEFKRLVEEERKTLPEDPRWQEVLEAAHPDPVAFEEKTASPSKPASNGDAGFTAFLQNNVREQRQAGYFTTTVYLPLGDMTSDQLRGLADIQRRFSQGTLRLTVDQNAVLRWVAGSALAELYQALKLLRLSEPVANTIRDITACPGTDTCKLGISASRGLASELMREFASGDLQIDSVIQNLQIKISGCFNSCAQHHIADIGFYGVSRKIGGHTVPHFQVVLGGIRDGNVSEYGLPILAVPSKRIPDVVRHLATSYTQNRKTDEGFQDFIRRIGKAEIKKQLSEFTKVPDYFIDKNFYTDWRDVREYSTGDMGVGECAGEVVLRIDFDLAEAERQAFDAQLALDKGDASQAVLLAWKGMLTAARGLVKLSYLDISADPDEVEREFRARLLETKLFTDPYMGNKFANYFLSACEERVWESKADADSARKLIEETGLFIEAAHSAYARNGKEIENAGKEFEAATA